MNTPQAIFGGLGLIAAAIYFGSPTQRVSAQTSEVRYEATTPATIGGTLPMVYVVDTSNGAVAFCSGGDAGRASGAPRCTAWAKALP